MNLIKLYKDEKSGANGCETVYLAASGELVVQGKRVDTDTFARLENVLPDEYAVRLSPEVLLGAMERYEELKTE